MCHGFSESYDAIAAFAQPAIISAIMSISVSALICRYTLRAQQRQHINNSIAKLIDYSIQFPYFEHDSYANSWNKLDKGDERNQRYDNYCCFLFNLLEDLWKFHSGDPKLINEQLHVRELVIRHRVWWKSERHINESGYHSDFCSYINSMLGE